MYKTEGEYRQQSWLCETVKHNSKTKSIEKPTTGFAFWFFFSSQSVFGKSEVRVNVTDFGGYDFVGCGYYTPIPAIIDARLF